MNRVCRLAVIRWLCTCKITPLLCIVDTDGSIGMPGNVLMLLNEANETMIPKIERFMGTTHLQGKVMHAVAAVVSATALLFLLVLFFQRQIVSGVTAGAFKR